MKDNINLKCAVCGNDVKKVDQLAGKILGLTNKFNVMKCSSCGQRMVHPQLSNKELDKLYSDSYFDNSKKVKIKSKTSSIKTAPTQYDIIINERLKKFERCVNILKKINCNGNKILDVGAASGDFLNVAKNLDLDVEGIEYSQYGVDKASELYNIILEKKLLSYIKKKSYYDFIHLNHVFEHFNNPNEELFHIDRLLKKDGVLYIEIPFQFNFIERLKYSFFKKKKDFTLSSIHHPFMYTPDTLNKILNNNGFNVIKSSVYNFYRYDRKSIIGIIKNFLWFVLSLINVGTYIEVYAKKK